MKTFHESARDIPVIYEADLCVLGGSCTGLFAAVRAARLGARVVIVEKDNCFGGTATTAMVNVWHSLWDTEGKKQIIAGLTEEVLDRLDRRGVLQRNGKTDPSVGFAFNSEELKIELDELASETGLKVYFHTLFVDPLVSEGKLRAVAVENKSGRGAIMAGMFIDATGDGDLAARLGCETYRAPHLQPATACARFSNWESLGNDSRRYQEFLREFGQEYGLPDGFAWGAFVPGSDIYMMAATRIPGMDSSNADDLTRGEIEGRRQVRAIQAILKRAVPASRISLQALPSRLGLRESRHVRCAYQLTGEDVLEGRRFDDPIAQGSYRVYIHHQDKPGITLRYLDGHEEYCCPGRPAECGRWRPERPENPTYYQIPFRSLTPRGPFDNLLVAGRMLDADPVANGAVRVMVNLNQTGEAAGIAATLALDAGCAPAALEPARLRAELERGGSAL